MTHAIDRRELLQGVGAAALVASAPAAAAPSGAEDARLRRVLDAFWDETLDASPQLATSLGVDTGKRAAQRSQLDDASRAGRTAYIAARADRLRRLAAIDKGQLSPAARVDHDVVSYQMQVIAEGGQRYGFGEGFDGFGYVPFSPYAISQITGPYQSVPDFIASNHPVASAEDAAAWVARLGAYAKSLDDSTESLRVDAGAGVIAPDWALDLTLGQLTRQRDQAVAESRLVTMLAQKAAAAHVPGDWEAQAASVIAAKVQPALDRQIVAIKALRGKSNPHAGVWRLPDGDAYYAGALGFQTTTKLTPQQVHELGIAQVADLTRRLDTLLTAQGIKADGVGARLERLGRQLDQLWPNSDAGRADLLKSLNAKTAMIRALLPRMFATLPEAPVEIVRVPPDIEDGAPNGYARGGSIDGKRPGRFYINLKDTAEWPKFTLPTLACHEALPGHVWQGAIARESPDIPMLRRNGGNFATYSAYTEGWALYAEGLADELGIYDGDPFGKIGYLQSLMFRAARLVADTGMHWKRWSREQATAYFVETLGLAPGRAGREIDRYAIWPGQACAYKIGHTEWLRLRAAVEKKQGKNFDIKAFHDVLRMGPMPLTVLARVVMARA